jgi:hypothetical protein
MALEQNSDLESISELLRIQLERVVIEPLPQRWVDLIRDLEEKECGSKHAGPRDLTQFPTQSMRRSIPHGV